MGCRFLHAALSPLDLPQELPVAITVPTATLAAADALAGPGCVGPALLRAWQALPVPQLPAFLLLPSWQAAGRPLCWLLAFLALTFPPSPAPICSAQPSTASPPRALCLPSLLPFPECYVKLSPERLSAQVLLCREQTLPLGPGGLCRGADPHRLGGVGRALFQVLGARSHRSAWQIQRVRLQQEVAGSQHRGA